MFQRWGASECERARGILGKYIALDAALAEIGRQFGRAVTKDALCNAFRRNGLSTPLSYLRSLPARLSEWDDEPTQPGVPPVSLADMRPEFVPAPVTPEPRKAPAVSDARVYLVLSDVHVPHHDRAAVAAVCEYARDLRPHGLILNGDILDLEELSRFTAGSMALLEGKRISKSWLEANRFLDQITEACGDRLDEKRYLDGNHESRLTRWLQDSTNAVLADDFGFSIPERLRLRERGFVYHAGYPDARVKLGHLIVTHGTVSGKYTAARTLDAYRHSVLVGHAHTPQMHYAPAFDGQQAAFVAGHLADVTSSAMDYAPRPNSWRTGFATVYVRPSGAFQVTLHQFWDGCFFVAGKQYGSSP